MYGIFFSLVHCVRSSGPTGPYILITSSILYEGRQCVGKNGGTEGREGGREEVWGEDGRERGVRVRVVDTTSTHCTRQQHTLT